MNCVQCNRCKRIFANLDEGDRSYPIHKVVFDSAYEKAYCDPCLDALEFWEATGIVDPNKKAYRAPIWTAITKRFRRWLMRLAVVQVPGGRVTMVGREAPNKSRERDDDGEGVVSPFRQPPKV